MQNPPVHFAAVFLPAALVLFLLGAGGCETTAPGKKKYVRVEAKYPQLANQTVVVFPVLSNAARIEYRSSAVLVCRGVSRALKENVVGIQVANPDHVIAWQQKNKYTGVPYSKMIEQFNVDRIVLVEVRQYSVLEGGRLDSWQGAIAANVGVVAAGTPETGGSGDGLAFVESVSTRFPEDQLLGETEMDPQTMEFATVSKFSREVGWLFYDHNEEQ